MYIFHVGSYCNIGILRYFVVDTIQTRKFREFKGNNVKIFQEFSHLSIGRKKGVKVSRKTEIYDSNWNKIGLRFRIRDDPKGPENR